MKPNAIYLRIFICLAVLWLASACSAGRSAEGVDEALAIEPTATIAPTPEPANNILFLGNAMLAMNGGVETHLQKIVAENESLPDIEVFTTYINHTPIIELWQKSKGVLAQEEFKYVVVYELFQNIWNINTSRFFYRIHCRLRKLPRLPRSLQHFPPCLNRILHRIPPDQHDRDERDRIN